MAMSVGGMVIVSVMGLMMVPPMRVYSVKTCVGATYTCAQMSVFGSQRQISARMSMANSSAGQSMSTSSGG